MKKLFFILFCLITTIHVVAQKKDAPAKVIQLKAFLDNKSFYDSQIGNYTEIHLQFLAYSLKYKSVNENDLQAEVAVQMIVRTGDKVVASDAYRLNSPIMRDSVVEDFYDIKRFALAPGIYELEISLEDLNAKNPPMTGKQTIEVVDFKQKTAISNLQIAEALLKTQEQTLFTKSGFEIIPRISNYFANEAVKMPVYFEIYHPSEVASPFGLKQSIKNASTKAEVEGFSRLTKVDVALIQPIVRTIDLEKLPTGEYYLEYELLNKDQEVLSSSTYYFENLNDKIEELVTENIVLDPFFQELIAEDSLKFYLASLIPISKSVEIKNILKLLKTKDNDQFRKYIQAYWTKSAGTEKPRIAFMNYKMQVQLVQRKFGSNFMNGFETDRGRVYLQYGAPSNMIIRETSPSDYPYEIWFYDKIERYSNKRFVFYNPDLVNNMYRLLHSDMIGELQNYRWQQQLAKRNSANQNIDAGNDGNIDHFGGNSNLYYNQH